ncbi:DUF4145 domain-containing protein [Psychrobacter sp. NPDC064578]|uniref:DUF4145 domain-containing protein n=1 Tax=Psychrobacter sp. NPDC064578 TaxID=3364493 RepID=UPI00384E24F5
MNRSLYKHAFTLKDSPNYNCPKCDIGLLRIAKDNFKNYTTFDLQKAMKNPEFEPEWIEYIFNCVFECNNDRCDGKVLCTGRGSVDVDIEVDDNGQQYQEYNDYYRPLYFHPNLELITIPKNTPADIKKLLNQSFELFFSSPSSAANLVRASIEEILNDQNIPDYFISKKGKHVILTLHGRIDKLPEKYDGLKDKVFALKWLGNDGSHSGSTISLDDAMDAYELIEEVLSKIYSSKDADLARLAKEINESKGPKK